MEINIIVIINDGVRSNAQFRVHSNGMYRLILAVHHHHCCHYPLAIIGLFIVSQDPFGGLV